METKEQRIAALQAELAYLHKYLPYADGPAYSQDTRRIYDILWEFDMLTAKRSDAA